MRKTIITFGVFDMFHYGHLKLFLNIKKHCGEDNILTVLVQDGEFIKKYKPDSKIFYSTAERVEILKNLRCIDNVFVYKNVDEDIKKINFDIWSKGPDQNHKGFLNAVEYCNKNNKQIIEIPRTEGICSSDIKNSVDKSSLTNRHID